MPLDLYALVKEQLYCLYTETTYYINDVTCRLKFEIQAATQRKEVVVHLFTKNCVKSHGIIILLRWLRTHTKSIFSVELLLASRFSFVHIRDMIRINMCVCGLGVMLGREWRKLGYGCFNCWKLEIWIILIFFFFQAYKITIRILCGHTNIKKHMLKHEKKT